MRGAKKVFTFLGFPIHIHFTFLILLALFVFPGWGPGVDRHILQLAWVPILILALLAHEVGHALAIKRLGYGRSQIMLWGMGGLCTNTSRYKPKDGLLIALAGPVAGALVGLPFAGLYLLEHSPLAPALAGNILMATVGFSLLNLLPIFPLDGGRALVYALRLFSKRYDRAEWSVRTAGLVGLIALAPLVALALFSLQLWLLFMLLFLGQSAWQAWRHGTRAVPL